MTHIYKRNFIFIADRYEEWRSCKCISSGPINSKIIAEVNGDSIHFELEKTNNLRILNSFDFSCLDKSQAILQDRVQYVNNTSDFNPILPIVCQLFYNGDNIEYIRFAMTNPDRLIEFYGTMIELGQPCKIRKPNTDIRRVITAEEIIDELKSYGKFTSDALMERGSKLYNDNANMSTIVEIESIVESLKLFVEAYCCIRKECVKNGKKYSVLMPTILMFIALCNYKIGNISTSYYIAKKALDEIDIVENHSLFTGIPRSLYGEDTIKNLINVIETNHRDEIDNIIEKDDIDETVINLDKLNQ